MTRAPTPAVCLSGAQLAARAPQAGPWPGARRQVRATRARRNTWMVILDDDPTGSQCVHGVPVITRWRPSDVAWACDQPGRAFFVLTNSRALNPAQTRALISEVAAAVDHELQRRGGSAQWVSRGDSTLRGHYPLELQVLRERAAASGTAVDVELLVPAYLEAGRVTASDIHYVRQGNVYWPVGATEYARDASFGYRASDLREYVAEKSGGTIAAADVGHLTLQDLRWGGPERVAVVLESHAGQAPLIVNALDDSDLEILALGVLEAQRCGVRVLIQAGPSLCAALLGTSRRRPLSHPDIFGAADRPAPGLVVVGSHVPLSTRQVALASGLDGLAVVELDVPALLQGPQDVARCARRVAKELETRDVMLVTSRVVVAGSTPTQSLELAHQVSQALVSVVRTVATQVPLGWVIAKGGITSADLATEALGIARAVVLGQLMDGRVSVWQASGAAHGARGLPYVVFAGNVGEDDSLKNAIQVMRGDLGAMPSAPPGQHGTGLQPASPPQDMARSET